jgi:hypothetical protein
MTKTDLCLTETLVTALTLYRIIDLDDNAIVAMGISTLALAQLTLATYQLNYPQCEFEIEKYS